MTGDSFSWEDAAPEAPGLQMYTRYYGFACDDCGDYVAHRDRARLARRRLDSTLCTDHMAAWEARERAQRAEATARRHLEDRRAGLLERLPARIDMLERRLIARMARDQRRAEQPIRGPRYSGPPRRGYVYRLYDVSGALLYVGKTWNVQQRLFGQGGHSTTKKWFSRVFSVSVTAYATEAQALDAEAWAIAREAPYYNVIRPAPRTPRSPRRLAHYAGQVG